MYFKYVCELLLYKKNYVTLLQPLNADTVALTELFEDHTPDFHHFIKPIIAFVPGCLPSRLISLILPLPILQLLL